MTSQTNVDGASIQSIVTRPILFSGPMVRAILNGTKTQTRRTIKLRDNQYNNGRHEILEWRLQDGKWFGLYEWNTVASCRCPYGNVGDRLWVRETWSSMPEYRPIPHPEKYDNKPAWYRADNDRPMWAGDKWQPSIFMPRQYSRITLEITAVRAERLHAISEADAIKEGAQSVNAFPASMTDRGAFAKLWEKINGKDSWAANPFVWVVEFKRV